MKLCLSNLEEAILRTLLYFDIFHYPLSAEEVYHFCNIKDIAPSEVLSCLRSQNMKIYLAEKSGFYFLKGEAATVLQRWEEMQNAYN